MKYKMISLLFILFLLLPSSALAQFDVPKLQGELFVQDFAEVLTQAEETELNQLGKSLEVKTKAQIMVMTVDSLEEFTIEEAAIDVFRSYQLGDKELNNGLLLLYAKKENRIRLEVGYGLEGAIPDGKAGAILDQFFVPKREAGQIPVGLMDTYKVLYNEVAKEYQLDESELISPEIYSASETLDIPPWLVVLGVIALVALLIVNHLFFGGMLTNLLLAIVSIASKSGGGGGFSRGGGGSSGGGGASR